MIVSYNKDGRLIRTSASNNDMTITVSKAENRRIVTVTANVPLTLTGAEKQTGFDFSKDSLFFLNGYQSWTDTKEFGYNERQKDLDKLPKMLVEKYSFRSSGDQSFYKHKRNTLFAFDIAYIKGRNGLFIGNRNYKNSYLIIEFDKKARKIRLLSDVEGKTLPAGGSFVIFDYMTSRDPEEGAERYFAEMTPRTDRKLFGYTSWYNHYQNISEEVIMKALDEADERFELFQIDDGFEPYVGDWLSVDETKFPNGLAPIVEKVHSRGMLAGIWLAPLAAEKDSELFKTRPELIRKDNDGEFVMAGANWSGFCPLDLDNPDAVDYVRTVLRRYVSLGFDFFKLDFLYASNLSRMNGRTRAETSEFIYGVMREELGGRLILGCGATLSNAFEKFDYMRIGPDVSLKFDDAFYMRYMHRERISTKVTLQNTVYRSIMNGHAFMNDPDVFLLRDDNIHLSEEQRLALTTINALFGSLLMTSDNPLQYDEGKKAVLDKALGLFRNADNTRFVRKGRLIEIMYTVDGKPYGLTYDTEKGVITNG